MRKMVYAVLFTALVFVGCDNGESDTTVDQPKKVDSKLVGEKWYEGTTGTEQTYFRFTENSFTSANSGVSTEITTDAYTSNGIVYATTTDTKLLSYVFVDPEEYDDEIDAAIAAGDEVLQYKWSRRKEAASGGNMVRFTVELSNQTVEWARWKNVN
jgi:hypothetical protein